ncbi:MAG: Asp-tRNA(Asn)/Glu-tRNA(Gln) amidotransferase subunit GatB [Patescibacteria group bacterium]
MRYTPIIGLEVHIELKTESKMFCSCKAEHFQAEPNTQTCPVCLGLPGALPVANKTAIEWTILTGLALNCQISGFSKFDRKNYFYPDLVKGYQISQYDAPLARNGKFQISNVKWLRIRRVHLEEDTGKLIHEAGSTLIDFNRSGVPLMEIVTEPDISSAEEAKAFLEKLQQIVRYLGVSEADMEKGQMRCEPTVNLKIEKNGKIVYTPLVELKNINSFRFVQKAIDYEIRRQLGEFEKTGREKQPGNKTTRGWDEVKQETVLQREKEEAADYRYFPEPDLPPMRLRDEDIKILREKLPELPDKKLTRFIKQYGLSEYQAKILVETKETADFYEEALRKWGVERAKWEVEDAKNIANWIVNKRVDISRIKPEELVKQIKVLAKAPTIAEKELEKIVGKVLEENQRAVEDFRKGKVQALEFLVGQVARETKGKADPNQTRQLLLKALKNRT